MCGSAPTRSIAPMRSWSSRSTAVLKGANFVEVPHEEIERAHRESVAVTVEIEAALDDFRDVRFFRRGHHQETFEIPRWFGLRNQDGRGDGL